MIKIKDKHKLDYYIEKYNIEDIFEVNMKPYMELFLFDKNEHIYRAGDPMYYFYFLVKGKSKVYNLLQNGKSLLLKFYKPLIIIGDVECIDIDKADSNIQAIEQCLCIAISMDNIRKYAINDCKFLKYICKELGVKLSSISKYSAINLLYPLESRFASYLLAITPEKNHCSKVHEIYTDKITEIAELLGASYRHLIRVIHKFEEQNIIKKQKGSIIILDRKALDDIAEDIYEV
ncbi:cyclic nucleotide-binding domain-containing protein [Clostridium amazonitimonense]|uniref:cyclic nucleotide-binding domain-containing protein n=1 Tax=Clostridium amazonitimonense TaxID=1499689 RepID=UPI000509C16C|nr:cyclic nucleotide-binding domain-containing protein [Clostridium amazonitimonense]